MTAEVMPLPRLFAGAVDAIITGYATETTALVSAGRMSPVEELLCEVAADRDLSGVWTVTVWLTAPESVWRRSVELTGADLVALPPAEDFPPIIPARISDSLRGVAMQQTILHTDRYTSHAEAIEATGWWTLDPNLRCLVHRVEPDVWSLAVVTRLEPRS